MFCIVSTWEGMPGAVMEAMARGVAVVGTDVNGTRDLVVDGETGVLVAPERPGEIAAALRALLEDRDRALAMGAAGRSRMEAEFSVEAMVERKARLYVDVARAA